MKVISSSIYSHIRNNGTANWPIRIKSTGFPDFSEYMLHRRGGDPKAKSPVGITFMKLTGWRIGKNQRDKRNDNYQANNRTKHKFANMHLRGPGRDYWQRGTNPPIFRGGNGNYQYDWTWHHHEVVGIMQLVVQYVHNTVDKRGLESLFYRHVGGAEFVEAATGWSYDNKIRKNWKRWTKL